MKIEKMADNKVKVIIPKAEMQKLGIAPDRLKPDAKELHALMFFIMQAVKAETDFNPFSGQVAMEAFPHNEGMCVIISKAGEQPQLTREDLKKRKRLKPVVKQRPDAEYAFYEFENLCTALCMADDELLAQTALYKFEELYILWVPSRLNKGELRHVLSEYGARNIAHESGTREFLEEHARSIASGNKLVKMVQGIRNL